MALSRNAEKIVNLESVINDKQGIIDQKDKEYKELLD